MILEACEIVYILTCTQWDLCFSNISKRKVHLSRTMGGMHVLGLRDVLFHVILLYKANTMTE